MIVHTVVSEIIELYLHFNAELTDYLYNLQWNDDYFYDYWCNNVYFRIEPPIHLLLAETLAFIYLYLYNTNRFFPRLSISWNSDNSI